jgi:radical SAM superfamily enzyme YgiQ (UPF0313 family)
VPAALQDASAFTRFGRPKLGFLVTSGVIDSMVNHYTVAKKRRHDDAYAPGGQAGLRPDRATSFTEQDSAGLPTCPSDWRVEASLRRFSHYDYWDERCVTPSWWIPARRSAVRMGEISIWNARSG